MKLFNRFIFAKKKFSLPIIWKAVKNQPHLLENNEVLF